MLSSKAYTEVHYIINQMSKELRSKIPEKIQKNIENKMDKSYEFFVENDDFENVELLEDTEKILSVLYTDYLATEEERTVILEKEKILAKQNEKKLPEIKIHEIFEENKNVNIENEEKEIVKSELIEINEDNLYSKIIKFLKNLFK